MADTTPTLREAAQQAMEAIEPVMAYGRFGTRDVEQAELQKAHAALRAALAEQAAEQAEPVAVPASIVAGAIFDFAGFLTTHKCVIKVGSTANASPVVERIKEWAGLRGLPIDDADVLSWQKNTAPPAPARQEPLTEERATSLVQSVVSSSERPIGMVAYGLLVARAVERAHGITAAPAEGGAA